MYRNFHIFAVGSHYYIVLADSKRFGKQAIVFEGISVQECINWIIFNYRNKHGERITNIRWVDNVYRVAMSTCNIPDNPWFKY